MARNTPESRIKRLVRELLSKYKPELYDYWPVPAGFGPSSLDCLICYRGYFIAVETKAPGKLPTPRQKLCISEIVGAGGTTLVIDSAVGVEHLEMILEACKHSYPQNTRPLESLLLRALSGSSLTPSDTTSKGPTTS